MPNFKQTLMKRILVIGASGQIGTELVVALQKRYGLEAVIASDVKTPVSFSGIFEPLDALNSQQLGDLVEKHHITDVYLLAALLSASAEKNPELAWQLNMNSLFNVLNLAKSGKIKQIFFPSSIAVFGPTTPKHNAPQYTVCEPSTVYGVSKFAGEGWCYWYHKNFGVDVRSLRYPGLISWTAAPGGGTTDYAVDIFHQALTNKHYTCFLKPDTALPMMYLQDAVSATIQLMEAPIAQIKNRYAYNLAACSFTPAEIAKEIQKHIPEFTIDYAPDFRQTIADSWPYSIDDSVAQKDWGWKPQYDLAQIVEDMIKNLKPLLLKG